MQKRDLPFLFLGFLLTATTSCRTIIDANGQATVEPELALTAVITVDAATAAPEPTDTSSPTEVAVLPVPSEPTAEAEWQKVGDDRAALSLAIPDGWVDLSGDIAMPAIGNRLGINLLLAADTERTGRSLLAGKPFTDGATVTGLLVEPAATGDLAADVLAWVAAAAPEAMLASDPVAITSANGAPGVAVEVIGPPLGLELPGQEALHTRIAIYAPDAADETAAAWIVVLQSAAVALWPSVVPIFDEMLGTVRVNATRPGSRAADLDVIVRGQLTGDRDLVSATLEPGVNDIWTFSAAGNRYTSLFLRPEEPQLDLTLTLYGPDRQTIARIDNGYAGSAETVTDLLLDQPGTYLVEVSEFFQDDGRYTLSFVQSDLPQYSTGGRIRFGEAIQGELSPQGQQYWVFAGTAGQRVSIVAEPATTTIDPVLELYGPDGQQLVTLDEGFSGDPEVISGFELPASGEYAILIRSFSQQGGAFTLSLEESGQEVANFYDAGDIAYGDVRQETLQRQEAHAWFFQGKAGDQVVLRVTPLDAALDLQVWLLDQDVRRIAAADETLEGERESIEHVLDRDGQYIVVIQDFNGEPGTYEIALGASPVATPESGGSLSFGDIIMGSVPPGASVAWTFNAAAGDVFDVTLRPTESAGDLILELQGPDTLAVLNVDLSPAGGIERIDDFVVPSGGQWRIVIREFFGDPAGYQLALERAQ
jgi:hypothetical protein